MKSNSFLLSVCLFVFPYASLHANFNSLSKFTDWREIMLLDDSKNSQCFPIRDACPKSVPYNNSKKTEEKNDMNLEKKITPEKGIESFDEWTKKRRDAAANQVNGNSNLKGGYADNILPKTIRKIDEIVPVPITGPQRNFASKECGAKVIASNPEAENAKAVVEKDVDDYMRNPCEKAKEKFIVIELCEAIQVKKFAIGNFELFASRPKRISVSISERYPPLGNWIPLGEFQLQDHHKKLQSFEVPATNVYAKFVRINLEDHYGKEHYCIVSVVNVLGTTLADEYEKEEEAVHMLNVLNENEVVDDQKKTTPPPAEVKMPTQLPIPPKSKDRTIVLKKYGVRQNFHLCSKCPVSNTSFLICHLLPTTSKRNKQYQSESPRKSQQKSFLFDHYAMFGQSRRRNLANIQRFLPKTPKIPKKIEVNEKEEVVKVEQVKEVVKQEPIEVQKPMELDSEKVQKVVEPIPSPSPAQPPKQETIVPAGGATNQREMVLMKLTKRVAAVELNLTLSTEYLTALSKQYVTQMSGYQEELKETRKGARESAKAVEMIMRNKVNKLRREIRELKHSVGILEQMEKNRIKEFQYDMARSVFVPSCHVTSPVSPQPKLARLPQIIGTQDSEERWRVVLEKARSVIFGSFSWNTDHLIVFLIFSNVTIVSILFAAVFYIYRRTNKMLEMNKNEIKNEMKKRIENVSKYNRNEMKKRIENASKYNRKAISKGLRKAELAVTAAVTASVKNEKSASQKKVTNDLEKSLANLFAAQQMKFDEKFEENKRLMKEAILRGERCGELNDTFSVGDSESSSETEQQRVDTSKD